MQTDALDAQGEPDISVNYFPTGETWQPVTAESAGADAARLRNAIDYAGSKHSKGVVILWRGRILAEQYWDGWNKDSVGPLYSATKSIVSTMVGMAIEAGDMTGVQQSASDFLPEWKGKPDYEAIRIEHLLTMTSGLEGGRRNFIRGLTVRDERAFTTSLPIDHTPGTHWDYHNGAYHLLFPILEAATGQPLPEYSRKKIFDPLGMEHARWFGRPRGKNQYNHMEMSTRDAARFGLLVLNDGAWSGRQLISRDWLKRATRSWDKSVNASYGYLWWLNGGDYFYLPLNERKQAGALLPDVPKDAFAALGKDDQKVYIVPSLQLVVARLGDKASSSSPALSSFDNEFLSRVCRAFDRRDR